MVQIIAFDPPSEQYLVQGLDPLKRENMQWLPDATCISFTAALAEFHGNLLGAASLLIRNAVLRANPSMEVAQLTAAMKKQVREEFALSARAIRRGDIVPVPCVEPPKYFTQDLEKFRVDVRQLFGFEFPQDGFPERLLQDVFAEHHITMERQFYPFAELVTRLTAQDSKINATLMDWYLGIAFPPADRPPELFVVTSATVAKVQGPDPVTSTGLMAVPLDCSFTIVAPCYVGLGGGHWVLVVLNVNYTVSVSHDRRIEVSPMLLDSLAPDGLENYPEVERLVSYLTNQVNATWQSQVSDVDVTAELALYAVELLIGRALQQRSATDCGIYVMMWLRDIASALFDLSASGLSPPFNLIMEPSLVICRKIIQADMLLGRRAPIHHAALARPNQPWRTYCPLLTAAEARFYEVEAGTRRTGGMSNPAAAAGDATSRENLHGTPVRRTRPRIVLPRIYVRSCGGSARIKMDIKDAEKAGKLRGAKTTPRRVLHLRLPATSMKTDAKVVPSAVRSSALAGSSGKCDEAAAAPDVSTQASAAPSRAVPPSSWSSKERLRATASQEEGAASSAAAAAAACTADPTTGVVSVPQRVPDYYSLAYQAACSALQNRASGNPKALQEYKDKFALFREEWLRLHCPGRVPVVAYPGGDCLFSALAALVKVRQPSVLRAAIVGMARVSPTLLLEGMFASLCELV